MKATLSTGLSALMCVSGALASEYKYSKTQSGSHKISCRVESTEGYGREPSAVHSYSWHFLWKYTITDNCDTKSGRLAWVLPKFGNTQH